MYKKGSQITRAIGDVAPSSTIYILAFVLETDISSIVCKDDVPYYTFDLSSFTKCS